MAYNGRNNYQNGQGGYNSRYQQPSLPDGYLDGGYFSPAKDGQKRAMKREYILGYPETTGIKIKVPSSANFTITASASGTRWSRGRPFRR